MESTAIKLKHCNQPSLHLKPELKSCPDTDLRHGPDMSQRDLSSDIAGTVPGSVTHSGCSKVQRGVKTIALEI